MSQILYSIDQVAKQLGLHVKTVRAYVRDGRLRAVRIGKQYRIARADLEALTGRPAAETDPVRRARHVEVSAIVEIDALEREAASRLSNGLMAAAQGRRDDAEPLRLETIYDEERARLKVIAIGGLRATESILALVRLRLEG